jgi:hypothetical protein
VLTLYRTSGRHADPTHSLSGVSNKS